MCIEKRKMATELPLTCLRRVERSISDSALKFPATLSLASLLSFSLREKKQLQQLSSWHSATFESLIITPFGVTRKWRSVKSPRPLLQWLRPHFIIHIYFHANGNTFQPSCTLYFFTLSSFLLLISNVCIRPTNTSLMCDLTFFFLFSFLYFDRWELTTSRPQRSPVETWRQCSGPSACWAIPQPLARPLNALTISLTLCLPRGPLSTGT